MCGLVYGHRWKGRGAGQQPVTRQRENPMQKQAMAWLVQESGRGEEWPECVV